MTIIYLLHLEIARFGLEPLPVAAGEVHPRKSSVRTCAADAGFNEQKTCVSWTKMADLWKFIADLYIVDL